MFLRFFLGIMILGSFLSTQVYGCETVDLNASPNSPFRKIPVYDQDGSGTCFAHAGAQLVDYWRLKNGSSASDLINPIYAAWQTKYLDQKAKDTRSGFGYQVIRNLKKNGYCIASKVNECLKKAKTLGGNLSDAELIYYLELLYKNYDRHFSKDPFSPKQNAIKAIQELEKDSIVGGSRCKKLSEHFLNNYLSMLVTTSNTVLDSTFKDCKPLKKLPNMPDPKVYTYGTFETKRKRIEESLVGGQPVTIAMCSAMFRNTKFRPLNSKNQVSNTNACGGHEVLITAKQKIGDSCHYLVRNSWGANWRPTGAKCACYRKDGIYESICSNVSKAKELVGCWFTKDDLLSNTYEITTFYGSWW